jgi:hypothetical protein
MTQSMLQRLRQMFAELCGLAKQGPAATNPEQLHNVMVIHRPERLSPKIIAREALLVYTHIYGHKYGRNPFQEVAGVERFAGHAARVDIAFNVERDTMEMLVEIDERRIQIDLTEADLNLSLGAFSMRILIPIPSPIVDSFGS